MSKLTKQGVRDLSNIGTSKSKGKKLKMPPAEALCNHRRYVKDSR